jgi:uncharacterized protein (UPF0264 family)
MTPIREGSPETREYPYIVAVHCVDGSELFGFESEERARVFMADCRREGIDCAIAEDREES